MWEEDFAALGALPVASTPHRLEPNTSAATFCATSEGTCLFSRSLIKDFQSKVTYFPN